MAIPSPRIRRALGILGALALAAPLSSGSALAQAGDFPNKPIRILVPFAAGSGADSSARVVADQMQKLLGQSMLVENRPGASGAIAAVAVKQAPADGYTILVGSNSPMAVNTITVKNLPYDPQKDFKAVHGIGRSMNVWYVANESSVKTLPELLESGKSKPVTIGTYSAGYQIAFEWVGQISKVKFNYVPYKGQGQVINDVIGRQLEVGVGDMGGALPIILSGRMRAIAVSGDTRHPQLPNVPTVKEVFPEYSNYAWTAFWVRSETPPDIRAKLAATMNRAMRTPEFARYIEQQGSEPMYDHGPDNMEKYQAEEIVRFRRVADAAGIKPE